MVAAEAGPDGGRCRRAVFLDRDGVLNVPLMRDGRSFAPRRLEEFEIFPDAATSATRLKDAGFLLVVVTNQPDVGEGLVGRDVVEEMNRRLVSAVPLDAVKVCFHSKKDRCRCRKPLPGMLQEAARELDIDLGASFMVGDRWSDVAAARAAGCRAVFVDLGYTADDRPQAPDAVVRSLAGAVDWITGMDKKQIGK